MAQRNILSQAPFFSAKAPAASPGAVLLRAWRALGEMAHARQTRRMLAEMDDRMLADIGIGRGDAMTEAARAPWDLADRRR